MLEEWHRVVEDTKTSVDVPDLVRKETSDDQPEARTISTYDQDVDYSSLSESTKSMRSFKPKISHMSGLPLDMLILKYPFCCGVKLLNHHM